MVLDRNPNFRGETFPEAGEENDAALGLLEDAGKVMPFVDKAIFSLEKESIPTWNKFLQGYYDTSGIASDSFDQAVQFNTQGEAALTQEMQDKDIQLMTAVTTSTFYTGFNMRDEIVGFPCHFSRPCPGRRICFIHKAECLIGISRWTGTQ